MNTPYQEALGRTLIERTIREKIILVGVILDDDTEEEVEGVVSFRVVQGEPLSSSTLPLLLFWLDDKKTLRNKMK